MIRYSKVQFLKDASGKKLQGCMISVAKHKPAYGWRTITKATSNEIVFNGVSRLALPSSDLMFYGEHEDSHKRVLRIYERNEDGSVSLKHMYALRKN